MYGMQNRILSEMRASKTKKVFTKKKRGGGGGGGL